MNGNNNGIFVGGKCIPNDTFGTIFPWWVYILSTIVLAGVTFLLGLCVSARYRIEELLESISAEHQKQSLLFEKQKQYHQQQQQYTSSPQYYYQQQPQYSAKNDIDFLPDKSTLSSSIMNDGIDVNSSSSNSSLHHSARVLVSSNFNNNNIHQQQQSVARHNNNTSLSVNNGYEKPVIMSIVNNQSSSSNNINNPRTRNVETDERITLNNVQYQQ